MSIGAITRRAQNGTPTSRLQLLDNAGKIILARALNKRGSAKSPNSLRRVRLNRADDGPRKLTGIKLDGAENMKEAENIKISFFNSSRATRSTYSEYHPNDEVLTRLHAEAPSD
jgi:hypothetical protein